MLEIIALIISLVDLLFLILIYGDDHAQRLIAEASLEISRESLNAQKQYLDLRRKWYESRTKKKESVQVNTTEQKGTSGIAPSVDSNSV